MIPFRIATTPDAIIASYHKNPHRLDGCDFGGHTNMHDAAMRGCNASIITLLKLGSSAHHMVDYMGKTPIFYAVRYNRPDVIETLARAGCNINIIDKYQLPLLFEAISRGHVDAIIAIVKWGNCQINTPDSSGHSPLFVALKNRNQEMIHVLRILGARINTNDRNLSDEELKLLNEPICENKILCVRKQIHFDRFLFDILLS